ncbi:hypothetical protein OB236_14810 [Paenibacillus sp. WQ 127069]|uniref:Uncharacterized protein n=1 Tax=Paenibacillus baimaensis TaxID=2982185 RepID=A0ABT2UHL1_9BACL|nr:hypothetical protein [Paenibacillus sp. WQ 127069]MCU6793377.1 hypothetical protein [Paenibacillus sp. WQ 127069]
MEIPTEELSDKVAFELQTAWDQGVEWGYSQRQKELDGDGNDRDINEAIQKLRAMSPVEREAFHQKINRRNERIQVVEEARRWKNVDRL